MDRVNIKPGRYVVAVSGGVDSIVLLDKLSRQGDAKLVVAHFDHGMRPDSGQDRQFVKQLAKKYGLPFEYAEGKLGPNASEARARTARYEFLKRVKDKYRAKAIVTAHHQDDVIETAIINILRGTKRRGLASLRSTPDVIRPLLGVPKFTIVKYGMQHDLEWREDASNQDTKYLRNYVRLILIPQLDRADIGWRDKFIKQIEQGNRLNQIIDRQLQQFGQNTKAGWAIERQTFVNLPSEVGLELLRDHISSTSNLDRAKLKKAWLFAKTAKPGARLELSKHQRLEVNGPNVVLTAKAPA